VPDRHSQASPERLPSLPLLPPASAAVAAATVPKVLGVEVEGILIDGVARAAPMKSVTGSGQDGDPWPGGGCICPGSSGIIGGGGIPWAEAPRLGSQT
jgi:hypothetical protein